MAVGCSIDCFTLFSGINARRIDTGFDAYRVAEWSGHTNVDRIKDHYAPRARALKEAYGEDWVWRAFWKS